MPPSSAVAAALAASHPHLFATRERFGARAWSDRRASTVTRLALAAQGPSCLFVGPIETASQERLEALYRQARDSYYSGKPLIVDDMFDKVELKLRLYGSKSVVKYPRCSLRRQSTYADAEEDPSQVFALAGIWILLLAFGISAFLLPTFYTISLAFEDSTDVRYLFMSERYPFELLTTVNVILCAGFGILIGYPVASASVQALSGLWRNDLVALKGSCPSCGEEVFAFVRAENSKILRQSTECHVCECALEFRTKVEQSASETGRRLVYGRIYLVRGT